MIWNDLIYKVRGTSVCPDLPDNISPLDAYQSLCLGVEEM